MEFYREGDWVFCDDENNSTLYGAIGYILGVKTVSAKVHFIQADDGTRINMKPIIEFRKLILSNYEPELNEDAFKAFMDLALQTRDYDWAQQLVEEYEQAKKPKELPW